MRDNVVRTLTQLPNLKEIYVVAGEFDIISLVSFSDIKEFREVLKNRIMKIKGIRSAVSTVIIQSHKGMLVKKTNPL